MVIASRFHYSMLVYAKILGIYAKIFGICMFCTVRTEKKQLYAISFYG